MRLVCYEDGYVKSDYEIELLTRLPKPYDKKEAMIFVQVGRGGQDPRAHLPGHDMWRICRLDSEVANDEVVDIGVPRFMQTRTTRQALDQGTPGSHGSTFIYPAIGTLEQDDGFYCGILLQINIAESNCDEWRNSTCHKHCKINGPIETHFVMGLNGCLEVGLSKRKNSKLKWSKMRAVRHIQPGTWHQLRFKGSYSCCLIVTSGMTENDVTNLNHIYS